MSFFYEIRSPDNTVLKRDGGYASQDAAKMGRVAGPLRGCIGYWRVPHPCAVCKGAILTIDLPLRTSGSTCSTGTTYATGYTYNTAQQVTALNYGNGVAADRTDFLYHGE